MTSATMQLMVAAALLDVENGAVMFVRRAGRRRWYPGLWDLPGGHVEPGESPEQALVREIGEELGVVVAEPRDPPVVQLYDYDPDGAPIVELSVWTFTDWVGEVRNNAPREHSELRWIGRADLAAMDLAHPEYEELVVKLL